MNVSAPRRRRLSGTVRTARTYGGLQVSEESGSVDLIERLAPAWRALCEEGGSRDFPFHRPEFVRAFVLAFAPKDRLVLISARLNGKLRAVLPLISHLGVFCGLPARQLRSASNVHSGRFDIVRAAGPEGDAAVEAIWAHLRYSRTWDLMLFTTVPEDGTGGRLAELARASAHRVKEWEGSRYPYVELIRDGAQPWLQDLSPQFRALVRRRTRQLELKGKLRLARIDRADPELLQQFYRLESSGWKGKEGTAILCHAATRRFYDEVAHQAERYGYFSLYLLYLDDLLIAGSFGLERAGCYYYLKPGYDETHRKNSPGQVLISKILLDCKERGLQEFDFSGPSQPYMRAWTAHSRPIHQYCIFQNSAYGRLLHRLRVTGGRVAKTFVLPLASKAKTTVLELGAVLGLIGAAHDG